MKYQSIRRQKDRDKAKVLDRTQAPVLSNASSTVLSNTREVVLSNTMDNAMHVVKPPYEPPVKVYKRGVQYKPGEQVLFPDGRVRVIPELDADGNAMFDE